MEVKDEITRRMRLLGLSPKQLSVAAGLNQSYVADILAGRSHSPRWENLVKISAALGCTIAELTGVAENPSSHDHNQTNAELLAQAYAIATRITAEEDPATRDAATASIAAAIYDVLVDRLRSGRPLGNEADMLAVIEAMIRRIRR
jgi:transcriptional regulator with XRE-family HTH domain